jgi:antitoxin component HigA of HigAB toxin-antitoxin module
VEGLAMGAAIKLIEEEVFNKIESRSPGETYDALLDHFPISKIASKAQCKDANTVIARLMEFTHAGRFNKRDLAQVDAYIQMLAKCVQEFETELFGSLNVQGHEMLSYLMELNHLKQSDLSSELGGQSVVSSILKGKRELNKKQIQKLAARFRVSVETFFDR